MNNQTIISKISELCKSKKISINQMLQETNLSKSVVDNLKKGSTPSIEKIEIIADFFNVSVDYLLGKTNKARKIPVYGEVAAGIPISAIEDIVDFEEITEELAAKGEYFGLVIKGDSMEPRMTTGDVVIVRSQDTAETGDIAIVLVAGETATCKKIKRTPEGVMLISLNPAYEPMFYTNKQIEQLPVRILGKVVELRAKF